MNIWMRFEDRYGCKTLFEYSNSLLLHNSKIQGAFSNSQVFAISKREAESHDYIIIIFDMDGQNSMSLTSNTLKEHLRKRIINNHDQVKASYANKIILIPVFFCFETMYLFSEQLQNTIKNIDKISSNNSTKMIKLYKQYYDYSEINPEILDNIASNIVKIQDGVESITGVKSSKKWLPQKFHLSYAKQLLKLTYRNVASDNKDNIFEKHENKLFEELVNKEPTFDINNIFDNLNNISINNHWFTRILNIKSLDELDELVLEKNLDIIYNTIDDYNKRIYGIINRNIDECASNIESILQFSNIKDTNYIRKICKLNGYTDEEIMCAFNKLSID